MRPASLGITAEGFPVIFLCTLSALVSAAIDWWPIALIFLLLTWFSCHFFRDPERVVPHEKHVAVSPADGRVIRIDTRKDPLTGEDRACVCVFMNVFSVHVNRAPVEGKIQDIQYFPGKYFNAAWDKAATENERCAYLLKDKDGRAWTMVQIAGLIARRIVCRVDVGDNLDRGQRYGMIRFGSRVDLYIPEGYTTAVAVGDTVFAGQSILARKDPIA